MEDEMENYELIKKIAGLESINDQLSTELKILDELARQLGFSNGLETLKVAAQELIEEEYEEFNSEDGTNPPPLGFGDFPEDL